VLEQRHRWLKWLARGESALAHTVGSGLNRDLMGSPCAGRWFYHARVIPLKPQTAGSSGAAQGEPPWGSGAAMGCICGRIVHAGTVQIRVPAQPLHAHRGGGGGGDDDNDDDEGGGGLGELLLQRQRLADWLSLRCHCWPRGVHGPGIHTASVAYGFVVWVACRPRVAADPVRAIIF
jgi:hypothetical protein